MNLIHQARELWSANLPLIALCPINQVNTNRAPKGTNFVTPYVRMSEGLTVPTARTSSSHYRNVTLQVEIWCNSYSTGRQIRDLLIPYLLNRTIDLEDGTVIDLSLELMNANEEDDDPTQSVWHFDIQFTAHTVSTRSSSG
jgi:hypothetical protein